jgi:hypothetical protein
MLEVKVLDNQGLANQVGPESCVGRSNSVDEALTGERIGRVLNRESAKPECRVPRGTTKATLCGAYRRVSHGLRAVVDPVHVRMHIEREP